MDLMRQDLIKLGAFNKKQIESLPKDQQPEGFRKQVHGYPNNSIDPSGKLEAPVIIKKVTNQGKPMLVFICSDGFDNMITEIEMLEAVKQYGRNASRFLWRMSLDRQKELNLGNKVQAKVGTAMIDLPPAMDHATLISKYIE